jgi:hypothetical protein
LIVPVAVAFASVAPPGPLKASVKRSSFSFSLSGTIGTAIVSGLTVISRMNPALPASKSPLPE